MIKSFNSLGSVKVDLSKVIDINSKIEIKVIF